MARQARRFGPFIVLSSMILGVLALLLPFRGIEADPSGGGGGPASGAPTGAPPKPCMEGARVGAPPVRDARDCAACRAPTPITPAPSPLPDVKRKIYLDPAPMPPKPTPVVTGGGKGDSSHAYSHSAGDSDGTLDPESGAINKVMPLEGFDVGSYPWSALLLDEPDHILPPSPPEDYPAGKGGNTSNEREDFTRVFQPGLTYNSQVNLNRMTGNWWFPMDVFVVPQGNGDLWYYGPGVVGAVYVSAGGGTYTSPPGTFDLMVQNANGTWTRTTKHGTRWNFDSSGYLASVVDRYGKTRTLNRGAGNQLLSWSDYAGRTTTAAYYANGYLSTLTDWAGRVWSFSYTAQGYLASMSYPSTTFFDRTSGTVVTRPKTVTFSYISGTGTARDGNLTQITDDVGLTAFATAYDVGDRAISSATYGRTWSYTYQSPTSTRVVDPDGVTIDYGLDGTGAIVSKTVYTQRGLGQAPLRAGEPNSYVWTFQRGGPCGCGQIIKTTRPDGSSIEVDYDVWGNMLQRRFIDKPGGGGQTLTETWTWSSFGQFCRMLTYISPMGHLAGNVPADFTTTWAHDALGSITSVTMPRAALTATTSHHPVLSVTRNTLGQPVTATLPGGTQVDFAYAATTGELIKITSDPSGLNIVQEFTYDLLSRLTTAKTPRGHVTTWTYNDLSQVTDVLGPQPLAPRISYLRDNNDRVREVKVENKDPAGILIGANPEFTTTLTYGPTNLLTTIQEEIDASTTSTTTIAYTPAGRQQIVTDPNGSQQHTQYDERGLVYKTTEGYGSPVAGTTTFDYDLVGQTSKTTDARGNYSTHEYNHVDWPTVRVSPNGLEEEYLWDGDGRSTGAKTYSSGAVLLRWTEREFDALGRLTSTTRHLLDATGTSTASYASTVEFGTALDVTKSTNALGNSTTFTRDALSRVTTVAAPTLDELKVVHDADGNPTITTVRHWNPQTLAFEEVIREVTFDALGRAAAQVTRDPATTLSVNESVAYDGLGRVLGTVDGLGNTVSYEWDARSLLLKTTRALRAGGGMPGAVTSSIVTLRQYDLGGRLTSLSDGLSQSSTYVYDARDRVTSANDPTAGTTSSVYDAVGNVTQRTDANGSVVTSVFDNMDRATSRTITPATGVLGTTSETFAYDELGRLLTGTDNDSTVKFAHDSLGRVTSETQGPNPLGGGGSVFTYGHDAVGSLTSVVFPGGVTEQRTYDAGARLSGVNLASGGTLATYTWAGSRVLQVALQNSVVQSNTFDVLWRRTRVKYDKTGTSIRDFEYLYNLASQRLLEKRHHAAGVGDLYELDSLYRTVKVKEATADPVAEYNTPGSQTVQATIVPTYDAANNRSSVAVTTTGGTTTTNYTADALNFYAAVGGTPHIRDANGNLTDDGTNLYDYDYRNQLVRVRLKSSGAVVAFYDYDVLGRRTSKAVGAATTTFLWAGQQMVEESDASGLVSRRHLGAAFGEVVSATNRDVADLDGDGSTTDYVSLTPMYDGAFDCVGVLDQAGALAESYVHSYDGKVAIANGAGTPIAATAVAWQQGYGRMYRDDETARLYSVFRYYSPAIGRFLTRDPAGDWYDPSGLGNGYAWVGNGYRNAWDPLGLKKKCCQIRTLFVYDTRPFNISMPGYKEATESWREARKKVLAALKGAGVGVDFVFSSSYPGAWERGKAARKRLYERNKRAQRMVALYLQIAAGDECYGVIHMGHGGSVNLAGQWALGPDGYRSNAVITASTLTANGIKKGQLLWLGSVGCTAWDSSFEGFTQDKDNFVAAAHSTAWPKPGTRGDVSGPGVADRIVRAVQRAVAGARSGN